MQMVALFDLLAVPRPPLSNVLTGQELVNMGIVRALRHMSITSLGDRKRFCSALQSLESQRTLLEWHHQQEQSALNWPDRMTCDEVLDALYSVGKLIFLDSLDSTYNLVVLTNLLGVTAFVVFF